MNKSNSFVAARVAVIGDVMLDTYVQGDVERISPEAPVPVIRLTSEQSVAGGAANVAANIASLGATVRLVGIAGNDEAFAKLEATLTRHSSIDLSGVLRSSERMTTTKVRVVGQRQQIARIDREDARPLSPQLEAEIGARAFDAISNMDLVVLSDYGKGLLTDRVLAHVFEKAKSDNIPVIVDPKRRDLAAYRGAAIVTPNRTELTLATGLPCGTDEEIVAAARIAQAACGADILVTRSELGMSFIPREGDPIHLPTTAREVFDVSGAGDTMVAVLGTALAAGLPIVEAMRAANHAAGIVVGKLGTATVTSDELASAMHDLSHVDDVQDGRQLSLDELVIIRSFWAQKGLTVGLANGCFDLLHAGHVSLVAQAAAACDRLVVALNTDASVRRFKGPHRPVQSQEARAEVLGGLKGVAAVVVFDEDTPARLVAALQPDLIVKGGDYSEEQVVGADIVRARGGTVLLARLREGQSTSRLITRFARASETGGETR